MKQQGAAILEKWEDKLMAKENCGKKVINISKDLANNKVIVLKAVGFQVLFTDQQYVVAF